MDLNTLTLEQLSGLSLQQLALLPLEANQDSEVVWGTDRFTFMRQVIQVDPIFEDSGGYLMARVWGVDGAQLLIANVSTISLVTAFVNGRTPPEGPVNLTPISDYVFDTYQTDDRWTADAIGYNFLYEFSASQIPTGSKQVQFEFKFTPVVGPIFHVVFRVPVINLLRS